jgi:hypothetical protein
MILLLLLTTLRLMPNGVLCLCQSFIHRGAWKENSQKSRCRTVHRAPVLRRSRPLRILRAHKADHYVLRVRIKMRSGAYASSRQDTDYAGAGGGQEFEPRVEYRRSGLPDMGVYTRRFEGCDTWSGRRVLETTFFAYRDL